MVTNKDIDLRTLFNPFLLEAKSKIAALKVGNGQNDRSHFFC